MDITREIDPRSDEDTPALGTAPEDANPCPEGTEELIPWLRSQYPEISPRTSDPRVIDACIARAGIIDLIAFIEESLDVARRERLE